MPRLRFWQRFAAKTRDEAGPSLENALASLEAGELEEAVIILSQLEGQISTTDRPDFYYVRGRVQERRGRWHEALRCYEECLERTPGHSEALLRSAHVLAYLFREREAEGRVQDVLKMKKLRKNMAAEAKELDAELKAISSGTKIQEHLKQAEVYQTKISEEAGTPVATDRSGLVTLDRTFTSSPHLFEGEHLTPLTFVVGEIIRVYVGGVWRVNLEPIASRLEELGNTTNRMYPAEIVRGVMQRKLFSFAGVFDALLRDLPRLPR